MSLRAGQGKKTSVVSLLLLFLAISAGLASLVRFSPLCQLTQFYGEYPFDKDNANRVVTAIQSGTLTPDKFGIVLVPSTVAATSYDNRVFVTRDGNKSVKILLPSYMEHETNGFRGYLFCDGAITSPHVAALGPVRSSLHGQKSWLMHLTIDRKIERCWYHVYGKLYQ